MTFSRQEIVKMLGAPRPSVALRMLSDSGVLAVICPELEECKLTPQGKVAAENVFDHLLATVDAAPRAWFPRTTCSPSGSRRCDPTTDSPGCGWS